MLNSIEESPSLIEQMRVGRRTAEAVFMKFADSSRFHITHAFCFYEGEDGKYYDSRISMKFDNNFITYPVGNKKEVLKLLRKINNEAIYAHICMMFFVDRDFDESLWGTDENLFETPCYSIENLYSYEKCFKQILQSEFGLNECDDDFITCLSDFMKRMDEFNNIILEFNALVRYRRLQSDSNSNFSFGSIKTSHLADISINRVTKSLKYDEEIDMIKSSLNVSDELLEPIKQQLQASGDFCTVFRGKNQLDFLCRIIANLKECNRQKLYFCQPLCCVHINITANRLSELSQYAITPPELTEFLDNHLHKLIS